MRDLINKKKHLIAALILSICCSIISIYNAIPNNDGILYLRTAHAFLNNGFDSAFGAYGWPFYSILIALLSKYSSISILNSAYIINTILQTGICLVYLSIFNKFKPTNSQLWFAVFIIIIFPQFNNYRHDILRDFGFWLFALLAIRSLMSYINNAYYNKSNSKNIILYYLWFFLAFLFRTEAIFIAFFLPFSILLIHYNDNKTNSSDIYYCYNFYKPIIIALSMCLLLAIACFIINPAQNYLINFLHLILNNLHFNLIKEVLSNYSTKVFAISNSIFPYGSNGVMIDYSFFIVGLLAVFIVKFIKVFNVFNWIFLSIFIKAQNANRIINSQQNKNYLTIILFAVFIATIIPTCFLYLVFITSGRYYLFSALLLLLFVPFGLDYAWQKTKINYKVFILANCLLFIIGAYLGLSGLISFGNSKSYIKQAGIWYQQQAFPKNITAGNSPQLEYFSDVSNHIELDQNIIEKIKKSSFEYFLLNVTKKNNFYIKNIDKLAAEKKITLLNTFSNKRQDKIVIIKRSH